MAGQTLVRMREMNAMILWQPDAQNVIPTSASTPSEIAEFAVQLSLKDRKQIVASFSAGHYEIALNYLWQKTIGALKKELSTVGVSLLAEMLGRLDFSDEDDINSLVTDREAIRLAGDLGVVSTTDALRLQHAFELVTHFSQMDLSESDVEEIDQAEAIASLKACIKAVLGRPKVEVAKSFVEFRGALEGESIQESDPRVGMLVSAPYFFCKLTVSVLVNAAKKGHGAQLENSLANCNVLIPAIWDRLRDAERWVVGQAYADAYVNGRSNAVVGIKKALLKVKGFDYVPENLRSDAFIKAAELVIKAHEGLNNFYNESAPVANLAKLGSTIPTPAVPACVSALLCVVLGNGYGVSWAAQADARKVLSSLSNDRLLYYIGQVLPSDIRVLSKLIDPKPRANWIAIFQGSGINWAEIKLKTVALLMKDTEEGASDKVSDRAKKLISEYYKK